MKLNRLARAIGGWKKAGLPPLLDGRGIDVLGLAACEDVMIKLEAWMSCVPDPLHSSSSS
jgi:hypothetical protein